MEAGLFAKLDKFHGKPEEVTLQDDDGTYHKFTVYPLPVRFMPMILKMQAYRRKAERPVRTEFEIKDPATGDIRKEVKEESVYDAANFSPEDMDRFFELMRDFVVSGFAHGISKGNTADEIEEIRRRVENFSFRHLEAISNAIMKVNKIDDAQEDKKKQ